MMGLGLVAVPKAAAETIAYNLNNINCDCLPAGTTSAGTVNVTDSGATLTFEVDLITGLDFHYTNAFDLFAFNYDGAGTLSLVGNISVDSGTSTGMSLVGPGSFDMDGAGHTFDYAIARSCQPPDCGFTGGVSGVNTLIFTIQSSSGPLNIADVAIVSGNNAYFAAAVTTVTGSGCTGVVSGGGTTPHASNGANSNVGCTGVTVPDGGTTLGLLGLGMLGLGYLRRRLA